MKKILSFIAFALTIGVQAQTKDSIDTAQFAVIYDYTINTLDDESEAVCDSIQVVVQVGKSVTKSMPMSQYLKETTKDMGEAAWKSNLAREYRETLTHMPTVWINQPEGETTSRDAIFPGMFEGYEPTPQMDWILTADTMHISGYVCSRAEITFKGVKWNVWYTEEVPSSAGPWRLRGLPGLIVKAEGNAHTFRLAELRQESTPITYASSVEIERVKHGKWVKYRKSILGSRLYPKNPVHHIVDISKYFQSSVFVIKDGENNHILANNMYLLQKAHVYQPLELE